MIRAVGLSRNRRRFTRRRAHLDLSERKGDLLLVSAQLLHGPILSSVGPQNLPISPVFACRSFRARRQLAPCIGRLDACPSGAIPTTLQWQAERPLLAADIDVEPDR